VAFLRQRPSAHDLVVSADTLCYFGPLEQVAEAAAGALRGAGRFVFTVEAAPEQDGAPEHVLHAHGRYSHTRGHVERALERAGFEAPVIEAQVLRSELGAPVQGWVVSARLADAAQSGENRV
jgi:predicted TPR repeat methyltransferase